MAISARKISSFAELSSLSGNEYLMVSYNGKSYKIPTSLLISNTIRSIDQTTTKGNGKDNPITITLSDGTSQTFHVYNGAKGSQGKKGDTGDKGPQGNSGVPVEGIDAEGLLTLIVDDFDNVLDLSDEELGTRILSARAGAELYERVENLKEEYMTQEEYDALLAEDKIQDYVKYMIYED